MTDQRKYALLQAASVIYSGVRPGADRPWTHAKLVASSIEIAEQILNELDDKQHLEGK